MSQLLQLTVLPSGQIDRQVICKLIDRSRPGSIIPYTLGFVRFVAVVVVVVVVVVV